MAYDQVALLFTLTAGILLISLPRKWALVPLLVVAFFLPLGLEIIIATLNFPMIRILILFGLVRLFLQSRSQQSKLNRIDKAMIAFVLAAIISYTLLWQTGDALINRLGLAFNALGIYFLVTRFVKTFEDIERVIKIFAVISVVVAIAMLVEWETGRNLFAVFGGVPEITIVREGRLRCQGAFAHPIMAGTFGASLLPLFVSLYWCARKHAVLAIISVVAATIITVTSSSSGPLLAYLAGIVGFCMWPLRKHMRAVRWGILLTVSALHLVMKAPVWALIGRLKVVAGSAAYHREALIDQFIRRFDEWWLLGTKSTRGWAASFLDMHDVTNQFIRIGVDGGLITLTLFIFLVGFCFGGVGRVRRAFQDQPAMEKLSWALGVALFVHVVSFMSVSYWDQMIVVWYVLLALISRLSSLSEGRGPIGQREPKMPKFSSLLNRVSRPDVSAWTPFMSQVN